MISQDNKRKQLNEDPDGPHLVFGGLGFGDDTITFLYLDDFLAWGNTVNSKGQGVVYHLDIIYCIRGALKKLGNEKNVDAAIEYLKTEFASINIKYKGSLEKAMQEVNRYGEDRYRHIYGRLWTNSGVFSIWDWSDKNVIKHSDTLYKIFKSMGVSKPQSLKWDFDTYAIGKSHMSKPQYTLQPQIKKPIGEVTLGDMMKYNRNPSAFNSPQKPPGFKAQRLSSKQSTKKITQDINISKEEYARLKKELEDLQGAIHYTPPGEKETVKNRMRYIKSILQNVSVGYIEDTQPKARWRHGIEPWRADSIRGLAEGRTPDLYRQLLSIMDDDFTIPHIKSISNQIKEDADKSTVKYRSTSLKDFLKDNT